MNTYTPHKRIRVKKENEILLLFLRHKPIRSGKTEKEKKIQPSSFSEAIEN